MAITAVATEPLGIVVVTTTDNSHYSGKHSFKRWEEHTVDPAEVASNRCIAISNTECYC